MHSTERFYSIQQYHHDPKKSDLDPELACLVHIADAVARNLKIGSGGDDLIPCIRPFALQQLAVEPEDLIGWEEDMVKAIEKDMSFLTSMM